MKEINHELPVMPPRWCGSICRNAMSDVCVGHCAEKRDCSFFEPKKNLKLGDLPRFPLKESANMTKEEKFTAVTIYLAQVVDHLNGTKEENARTLYQAPRETFTNTTKTVAEIANLLLPEKPDATKE